MLTNVPRFQWRQQSLGLYADCTRTRGLIGKSEVGAPLGRLGPATVASMCRRSRDQHTPEISSASSLRGCASPQLVAPHARADIGALYTPVSSPSQRTHALSHRFHLNDRLTLTMRAHETQRWLLYALVCPLALGEMGWNVLRIVITCTLLCHSCSDTSFGRTPTRPCVH